MRWLTHLAAGVLVAEAVAAAFHPASALRLGCLGAALAGALAPDLDHLPGMRAGHRTLTHSLAGLGGAIWLAAALHLPAAAFWAWAGAWASHIALDCLSPGGCPLLWPLASRFRLARIPTGGAIEAWLLRPALLLGAAAGLYGLLHG